MSDFEKDDFIEKLNEEDVEEIPPTPIAPEAPEPNFTEAESAGGSSAYDGNAGAGDVYDESEHTANVLAIISLVCGILSLLCCCIIPVELVLSVAAVVCGIIALSKGSSSRGLAIAGIACGGVGVFFAMCMLALSGLFQANAKILDGINFDELIP